MGNRTRQWGTLANITDHHLKRYEFAISKIPKGSRVLDAACGCGYGSFLMHQAGNEVTGLDISQEAVEHGKVYFPGPNYVCHDAREVSGKWDVLVSIETLEHMSDPERLLKAGRSPLLIASVPNENLYPFHPSLFIGDEYPHQRHYTPDQFTELLEASGYHVAEKYCQRDKVDCEVIPGTAGKFLIYVAEAW